MTKIILALLSMIVSLNASADTVQSIRQFADGSGLFPTVAAACANWAVRSNAQPNLPAGTNFTCASSMEVAPFTGVSRATVPNNPPSDSPRNFVPSYSCPSSSYTLSGDQLSCTLNVTPPPPTCTGGVRATYRYDTVSATGARIGPLDGSRTSTTASDGNSCQVQITGVDSCFSDPASLKRWCYYETMSTGSASVGGDPGASRDGPPAATQQNTDLANPATPRVDMPPSRGNTDGSCPAGAVAGGIDSTGIPICIGSGTIPQAATPKPTVTTSPPVTTSNADGSSTVSTSSSVKNADGSTTTTVDKVTTAGDGTKTQSQNVSTSASTAGTPGQPTPPLPPNDLCKDNPNLTICKNSSVSGTCGAISCTGDAIQCATLRAAAAMECKARADDETIKAMPAQVLGASLIAGSDPLSSTLPKVGGATIVQAPSSLDNSGWLGGGSCFADKTVVVMGKSITLPFSKGCDALVVLRYALMVVAALASFKIISAAVLT